MKKIDEFRGALDAFKKIACDKGLDTEAKRIHDEGMVTVGHMREKIAAAVAAESAACASLAGDLYANARADEIEMAIQARSTQ
jgi:hypothetical protein